MVNYYVDFVLQNCGDPMSFFLLKLFKYIVYAIQQEDGEQNTLDILRQTKFIELVVRSVQERLDKTDYQSNIFKS